MQQTRTNSFWLTSDVGPPRGILNPPPNSPNEFWLSLRMPDGALASFIDYYWILKWDLRKHGPHTQRTLPQPNVHVAFEPGNSRAYGIVTGKYSRCLKGKSRLLAIKFAPGMFRPFLGRPVSQIANRTTPVREVFGGEVMTLEEVLISNADEDDLVAAADAFFRSHIPNHDENAHLSKRLVLQVRQEHELHSVHDLAARSSISKRRLERLFAEYVGTNPKWVIRLYRLHDAVERLRSGDRVNGAQLAHDLGYFDQPHLINDFRSLVGYTPAQLPELGSSFNQLLGR